MMRFRQEYRAALLSVPYQEVHVMLIHPITSLVNFERLVKAVCQVSPLCKYRFSLCN